jgi:predicted ATPase
VAMVFNDRSIVDKLKRLQFLVKNNNYMRIPSIKTTETVANLVLFLQNFYKYYLNENIINL